MQSVSALVNMTKWSFKLKTYRQQDSALLLYTQFCDDQTQEWNVEGKKMPSPAALNKVTMKNVWK